MTFTNKLPTLAGKWLVVALAPVPALVDLVSTSVYPSGFWTQFVPSLYYASIVIAGLQLGWKAGLSFALFAGICHSLIAYLILASSFARLEGQLLAFLIVGFALVEQRRKLIQNLASVAEHRSQPRSSAVDAQACVDQVSAVASELLREVRTPIASIEGAAFILGEDGSEFRKPLEFVDIIRRECRRVNTVLLEISACTDVLTLELKATDVASMLGEAVRLSALEHPDPAIGLRTEVASDLPQAWCDKAKILSLIVPFLVSAMDSMPRGGELLLTADRQDMQARIQLKVLGQTVRASDPSAGLGPYSSTFDASAGLRVLAARRTVLQHGGTIEVDQTGQITRFVSLTLPLYTEPRP